MSLEFCSYAICPAWDVCKENMAGGDRSQIDIMAQVMITAKACFVNAFYLVDMSDGVRGLNEQEYGQAMEQVRLTTRSDELAFMEGNPEFVTGVYGCVEKMLTTTECTLESIARLPGVEA